MFNFLIGERGVGKSFGMTKFLISQFLKKGEQFAYVRRYKSDLSKSVPTFFNAINSQNIFPDHSLVVKHNQFYCNDKVCGYPMQLSTSQDLKSSNFDKVKTIVFDEFGIEDGQRKYYLKNEVFTFLNLVETITRLRDSRVFFLSNAVSLTNPYFLFFDLSLPYNNDIKLFKDGLILVQYMKNEAYRENKRKTKFGKLVEGTPFADYAIENKFLDNDNTFIQKKEGSAKFYFAFISERSNFWCLG